MNFNVINLMLKMHSHNCIINSYPKVNHANMPPTLYFEAVNIFAKCNLILKCMMHTK